MATRRVLVITSLGFLSSISGSLLLQVNVYGSVLQPSAMFATGSFGLLLGCYFWAYEREQSAPFLLIPAFAFIVAFPAVLILLFPVAVLVALAFPDLNGVLSTLLLAFGMGAGGAFLVSGAFVVSHPRQVNWPEMLAEVLCCVVLAGVLTAMTYDFGVTYYDAGLRIHGFRIRPEAMALVVWQTSVAAMLACLSVVRDQEALAADLRTA